jgi:hypothetical protein
MTIEDGTAIVLPYAASIAVAERTRNYDVPVACATKWSGSVSQLSFRIFLPRGFYLERDGGARVPIVEPRREIPSTKGVL